MSVSESRFQLGRLGSFVEGYRVWLLERGYSLGTVEHELRFVGVLGRWMAAEDLAVAQLDSEVIAAFVEAHRVEGRSAAVVARGSRSLPIYLRELGVVGPERRDPVTPLGALIEDYRKWLVGDRGLAPLTMARYLALAARFLGERVRVRDALGVDVYPESYVPRIPQFEDDSLAFLDEDPDSVRTKANRLNQSLSRVHSAKLTGPSKLHQEKFSNGLMTELCQRGLARRDHGPWIAVEHDTAALFMAYLAVRLCELDDLAMDPVTGSANSLKPFAMPGFADRHYQAILEIALPAPAVDTSPKDLATFKERHHHELRSFRNHIETSLLNIAVLDDPDVRRKRLALLKDGLAIQLDELSARMRERGWRSGTVLTLLQVVSPAGRCPSCRPLCRTPARCRGWTAGHLLGRVPCRETGHHEYPVVAARLRSTSA
jgi:hypothetical protein